MEDIKALQQERVGIFKDVLYNNKVPKRVPINLGFTLEYVAQYGGLDMAEAQWNTSLLEEPAEKLCQTIFSDTVPYQGSMRFPSLYQILGSQSFVMGSNGFIQHPEVVGMLAEDYDYLIEKPLDCLLERIVPRQYKSLSLDDPVKMMLSMTKGLLALNNEFMVTGMGPGRLIEKYGYYPGNPPTAGGATQAPFDFIADQLRGFKEISMDIRRMPEKLVEACEAVYPIVFKKGMPAIPIPESSVFMPLHMPTFMREKDFARLWWPSFKRLLEDFASYGVHCELFCEDDWTRYADYLYDLPTDTVFWFEYGDPKILKEKLGKKHIIKGLYPLTMLKSNTKQQCIDKAKEMLDVLAPGGRYIFTPDKSPLILNDIDLDNYCAVTEFIRDNGVYANAGETSGLKFNKGDYKVDPTSRKLDSKYYIEWNQLKSQYPQTSEFGIQKLQGFENQVFNFVNHILT